MAEPARRMKATRAEATRHRVAEQVSRLSPAAEKDALDWIESVAEFDETR